jgi:hypothetical protein
VAGGVRAQTAWQARAAGVVRARAAGGVGAWAASGVRADGMPGAGEQRRAGADGGVAGASSFLAADQATPMEGARAVPGRHDAVMSIAGG